MFTRTTRPAARALPLLAAGVLLAAACTGGGGSGDGEEGAASRTSAPTAGASEAERPVNVLAERWRSDALTGQGGSVVRMWVTDDTVVVVTRGGVEAYDAATGERRWELQPPLDAAGGAPCAASADVNGEGIGALLYDRGFEGYGDFGGCGVLVVVDTGSGEVLWREDLPNRGGRQSDHPDVRPDAVTIGDEVITASTAYATSLEVDHYRFSLDGRELPPLRVPGGEACQRDADRVHSAAYTVAESRCGGQERLTLFRTQSGQELWTRPTPLDEDQVHEVLATAPPAVVSWDRLISFTDGGEILADVELPGGVAAGPRVARGSVLAVPFETDHGLIGFVGVDLRTGEPLWEERPRAAVSVMAGDDQLLAVHPDHEEGHRLVRLDARDGTRTEVGTLPAEVSVPAETLWLAAAGDTLYAHTGDRLAAYRLP